MTNTTIPIRPRSKEHIRTGRTVKLVDKTRKGTSTREAKSIFITNLTEVRMIAIITVTEVFKIEPTAIMFTSSRNQLSKQVLAYFLLQDSLE